MSDTPQPSQPKPPKRDPAFPLYADDFLSGTADMSAEEVGAYIRLLCHQWAKGGLPNDEPRLARMAGLIGSPSLGYVLARFSPCPDGLLRHPRLEAIRAEREAYKTRQADSGAAGARRRWAGKRNDPEVAAEIEVKVKEKIAVAPVKAVVGAAATAPDDEAGDDY